MTHSVCVELFERSGFQRGVVPREFRGAIELAHRAPRHHKVAKGDTLLVLTDKGDIPALRTLIEGSRRDIPVS